MSKSCSWLLTGFLVVFFFSYAPSLKKLSPTFNYASVTSGITLSSSKAKANELADVLVAKIFETEVSLEKERQIDAALAIVAREEFCVPWEVDLDGWWTHHADWAVSMENDTHYCFAPMAEPEKASFFRKLYANQFESDCSTVWTKQMWSSGWGADFCNVVDALQGGLEHGRPIQMYYEGGWHYAATKQGDKPVCPSKDMYCFFLPMTPCQPDVENVQNSGFRDVWDPKLFGRPDVWYLEYAIRPQKWLRQEVYNYAKNAVPKLISLAEEGGTCATLHVRRADVILHDESSRPYYKIEEYLMGVAETLGRDVPKDIFLLSDDQNAISEAKKGFPGYNWMYLNRTRFKGASGGWENQIPSGDPRMEVIVLLSTFKLIQNCNMIIHTRSSFAEYMWGVLLEHAGNSTRVDLSGWMDENHVKTNYSENDVPE